MYELNNSLKLDYVGKVCFIKINICYFFMLFFIDFMFVVINNENFDYFKGKELGERFE